MTKMDTVRLRKRRDSKGEGAIGLASATKTPFSRLSQPRWRRRDFPDRGGDGAIKNHLIATLVEAARILRSEWRRRDFSDQGEDGATL